MTSTLDGKTVLHSRIRWLADADVSDSRIARVDFLIDGKLLGVERVAPYNYGSDDPTATSAGSQQAGSRPVATASRCGCD